MKFLAVLIAVIATLPAFGEAPQEFPNLSGSWALFQVISDYWEVPLLGERPRRIYQIAKIWIEQNGPDLILTSEQICMMVFDMGTSLVQISISPQFLQAVKIGPLSGKITKEGDALVLEIPRFVVINGAILSTPDTEPLPTSPDDPRVIDLDGDGKPGFTVKVRVLGLISGETYVVQRLRQEYRGIILEADLVRGTIEWIDEQVTLGASASFFLISGKGRPDPDPNRSFFVMKKITGTENCTDLTALFREELEK